MKTNNLAGCDESPPVFFQNIRSIALSAVLVAVCQLVRGQDLPFDSGSTGADGPGPFHVNFPFSPARGFHSVAFDGARGQAVLFGGWDGSSYLNDTWVWQGSDWIKRTPTSSPPKLAYFPMTWDAARQQVVIFGGYTTAQTDKTWVWDGTNWTEKLPINKPAAREAPAMAYDSSRHEVVLFGGFGAGSHFGDTWIWDGTNWTVRTPPSNSPPPRRYHAMAYDEGRHETVMFGGYPGPLADTWTWDGTNWAKKTPSFSPSARSQHTMAYDAARQNIVLFAGDGGYGVGNNETWIWNGADWTQVRPQHNPPVRYGHAMAYDPIRNLVVMTSGVLGGTAGSVVLNDTWTWDGTDWVAISGGLQTFDASVRTNGIWNFTTISVPQGLTVLFKNNRGNTPIRWLATGNMTIDGTLDLNGQDGVPAGLGVASSAGGSGGFAGGVGGTPSFQGSSPAGGPGQGPGGGLPGLTNGLLGQAGAYASSYGNSFIVPLIGGSGGGGSAASGGSFGSSGGGGGGAILIASSRDMTITGTIRANGGAGYSGSGAGSGGAIRLRADRITIGLNARLEATNDGRIRLESYERAISGTILPTNVLNTAVSGLVTNLPASDPTLLIASVAGQNVQQPPSGDLLNPDVIFTGAGVITVNVLSQNVPDGTPVRLRVAMTGNVITKPATGEPPVVLAGGTASFSLLVPKGRGTIQALADYTGGN